MKRVRPGEPGYETSEITGWEMVKYLFFGLLLTWGIVIVIALLSSG